MERDMKIADYIVIKSNQDYNPLTNIQLQNVMYCLNVIYLFEHHTHRLFIHPFRKTFYGPINADVYKEYLPFGGDKITHVLHHVAWNKDNQRFISDDFSINMLTEEYRTFIDSKLAQFYKFTDDEFLLTNQLIIETQYNTLKTLKPYDDYKTVKYFRRASNQFWNDKCTH